MTSPRLLYSKQRHRFPPARHTSHPHLLRIQSRRLHLHRTRSSTAFLLQRLSNSIKIHFTFEPTISFQILKLHKKLSRPPPSKAAWDSAIKSFLDEHLMFRVHVGNYVHLVLGVKGDGAPVAVVGPGREYAEAKYSDWIR
ncbi:hypothetical protein OIU84_020628 [Salix udensis]|uniref:Uncharacterized protein n=1 Tax=Salix udensis TaxID=889485 RepID=A0AAD6PH83_9ROSI|nr:hypothetical protein OIU84_020628 [Salix udensis]